MFNEAIVRGPTNPSTKVSLVCPKCRSVFTDEHNYGNMDTLCGKCSRDDPARIFIRCNDCWSVRIIGFIPKDYRCLLDARQPWKTCVGHGFDESMRNK